MSRRKLPNRRKRTPVEFEIGGHKFVGGFGHYEDGSVGEVFLTSGKTGTSLQIMTCDAAIAASLALQAGVSVETLANAFLKADDDAAAGPLGKMFSILLEEENARHKR